MKSLHLFHMCVDAPESIRNLWESELNDTCCGACCTISLMEVIAVIDKGPNGGLMGSKGQRREMAFHL